MAEHYDVIVAGGGSAGVAAAIGSSRLGARTLLVERGPCLGGAATMRNVLTYCGIYTRADPPRQVVFGVADDVLAALRAENAVSEPQLFTATAVVFDPETVKRVMDDLCRTAGVEVRLHSQIVDAQRESGLITAIDVADHQGIHQITGTAFVDATGEADLATFGGAGVRYGNEGRVQNGSLGVRFGGIPANVDLSRTTVAEAVLTARDRGVGPLVSAQGLVTRLPISGDVITYLVDEGYDARDAREVSRAEAHARIQAKAYLEVIRSLPGCSGAYIVSTGPEIGTRESRHIVAHYQVSGEDVLGAAHFDDAIAVGAWPIEYHPGPGIPSEWSFITGDGHFDIPLRALRSIDTDNLLVAGRNIDGDRAAGGSLRVMGTAFATGHAAGIAAAYVTERGPSLDVADVQAELSRQHANLPHATNANPAFRGTVAVPVPGRRPRVGHIEFMNCFPLLWGLTKANSLMDLELTTDTPDRLSSALVRGELDIGPISLIELLRNADDLVVLPDIAIGSDGPVMSCLILSRVPLDQLDNQAVALGSTSRTAVRLAQLLLNERIGVRPEYFTCPPDLNTMLTRAPAVVLIGDIALRAALYEAPRLNLHVHDLGQMWREWTGLPFVFAVFAARRDFARREPETVGRVHAELLHARDIALANVDQVCEEVAHRQALDAATLKRYYIDALDFTLGDRHLAGIAEFTKKVVSQLAGSHQEQPQPEIWRRS